MSRVFAVAAVLLFLLPGPACWSEPSPLDDGLGAQRMSLSTEDRVRCDLAIKHTANWIKKYKLKEWDITVNCGIPDEFLDRQDGFHGATQYEVTRRVAIVWVNVRSPKDPEEIVIHELLHLVMQEVIASRSGMMEERAVYDLAELLYHSKGKGKKCGD